MRLTILTLSIIIFSCSSDCNTKSTFFESGNVKTHSYFINCDEKEGNETIEYAEEGNIVSIQQNYTENDSSVRKLFYDNSAVRSIITKKKNLIHGEQKHYYADGPVREMINYVNGKKEGKTFIYDDLGNPTQQLTFRSDSLIESIAL